MHFFFFCAKPPSCLHVAHPVHFVSDARVGSHGALRNASRRAHMVFMEDLSSVALSVSCEVPVRFIVVSLLLQHEGPAPPPPRETPLDSSAPPLSAAPPEEIEPCLVSASASAAKRRITRAAYVPPTFVAPSA